MTSIIKNQILKHLSKFAKNLTADKVNISTVRGEGEMYNLELNEAVMTDLLELPAWMRISRVWCNRVAVRISWTKLKSVPIHVSLDEVQVAMETCEELRPMGAGGAGSAYTSGGRYGFSDKVVDGMTVTVNACSISFKSRAFEATVQISRIVLESKSPTWQRSDLRMTRLRDPDRGEVLVFKELQWQTLKVEARSTVDQGLSPLRLITNQSHCRIVIKKKLIDCSVVGCRLVLILDDLLWVLTDEQMKAALHFIDSLSGLIQKTTERSHQVKAVRKLESLPEYQAQQHQTARRPTASSALSRVFAKYDVLETSYHLYSDRIDLHLCDDPGEGRCSAPELEAGGALQVTLRQLELDYYPYHLAFGERRHWVRYGDSPPARWLERALAEFRARLAALLSGGAQQHTPLARAPPHNGPTPDATSPGGGGGGGPAHSPQRAPPLLSKLRQLMSSALVARVGDFVIYRVSTSQRKTQLREFVMGDKDRMSVPGQHSSVHIEFTQFYYPGHCHFPVPPPKVMVHINPVQVVLDPLTVLWLNAFTCNLSRSVSTAGGASPPYLDLRLEAIMPRLVLEASHEYPLQRDRPSALHLQTTRLMVCNYRPPDPTAPGSLSGLAQCLERLQAGDLVFGAAFPSRDDDPQVVPDRLVQHTLGRDHVQPSAADVIASSDCSRGLPERLLWGEPRDILFLHMDPFWADFLGTPAVRHRPVPLLDAIPLSVWVYQNAHKVASVGDARVADLTAVLHVPSLVSVQLNHFQYLFLLRLQERLAAMSARLSLDAARLLGALGAGSQCVSAVLPQLDVSLLMPCQLAGKDSSGGDLSAFPDSSSVTSFQEAGLLPARGDSLSEVTAALPTDPPLSGGVVTPLLEQNHAPSTSAGGGGGGGSPAPPSQLHELGGAGLSHVKKGFSSILSSIDSALKSPDDQSDTVSVMSDMSSDSDSYVLLNLDVDGKSDVADPLFVVEGALRRVPSVEIASEVTEDSHSELSVSSALRKRDVVSALTLRLGRLELVQHAAGNSSSLKLSVGHIATEECSAIGWDEFQAKFQLRTKGWQGLEMGAGADAEPCCVRLRMDTTFEPVADQRLHPIDVREQLRSRMEVVATDVQMSLLMTTVTGLTDFIEDELLPVPLPMQVHVERAKLRLTEDRPPNNITSPGVVPLDVSVPAISIFRGDDGVFIIQKPTDMPGSSASYAAAASTSGGGVDVTASFNNASGGGGGCGRCGLAQSEAARLRQRCHLLETQLTQKRAAQERLTHLSSVETRCREAEDEVVALRAERESLMKTLRYLQEEFLRLDTALNRRNNAK